MSSMRSWVSTLISVLMKLRGSALIMAICLRNISIHSHRFSASTSMSIISCGLISLLNLERATWLKTHHKSESPRYLLLRHSLLHLKQYLRKKKAKRSLCQRKTNRLKMYSIQIYECQSCFNLMMINLSPSNRKLMLNHLTKATCKHHFLWEV